MNNIATIQLPSVTFSHKEIHGRTIYGGVDEFTQSIAEQLRGALIKSGLECSEVKVTFKPAGHGFKAVIDSQQYFITASIEEAALPKTEVLICADPSGGAHRNWVTFEPFFRNAVKFAFPDCASKWMSVDEFVQGGETGNIKSPA